MKKVPKQKGNKRKQPEPDCVKEQKAHISSMIDCILEKNYGRAHKYLEKVIESKIQQKISDELQKPLF